MAGVVLENVSRVFPNHVVAVDEINLEVRDRELLVLVGPSGCGKTTTLRMIAGLDDVSSGTIRIGKRVVNDVPPAARDVAMVFQTCALYPQLDVERNLAFSLELRQRSLVPRWLWRWALPCQRKDAPVDYRQAVERRVASAAKLLGIEDLLKRYPSQISGGERQRVALGRALVRQPAVFLLDEPLSNLDAQLRIQMRRELKQLHEELRTTMIYVTHDQVEALTLGDRVAVMNHGKLQQVGRPVDLYDWPCNRFVASFIGSTPMSFLRGQVELVEGSARFRHGEWTVGLTTRQWSDRGAPRSGSPNAPASVDAVLGARPEDWSIVSSAKDSATGGLPAIVKFVESVGDSTLVAAKPAASAADSNSHQTDDDCVMIKVNSRIALRKGDRVNLNVDAPRVHVFDPATGLNRGARDGH